jgi:2-oxoglutarate dehydrogenase E2 component (dihydrolipoamide succinyltransferase)
MELGGEPSGGKEEQAKEEPKQPAKEEQKTSSQPQGEQESKKDTPSPPPKEEKKPEPVKESPKPEQKKPEPPKSTPKEEDAKKQETVPGLGSRKENRVSSSRPRLSIILYTSTSNKIDTGENESHATANC